MLAVDSEKVLALVRQVWRFHHAVQRHVLRNDHFAHGIAPHLNAQSYPPGVTSTVTHGRQALFQGAQGAERLQRFQQCVKS